ncbi:porin [Chitinimonas sp. BJYL2]|uniref:porin n=1 Tax=Chitinimonas sp. BJYL2 TaxID=2976696 RepID=UPI0022B2CBD4|nr:porin [Chitinimonas sp. BJYL2]
MRTRLLAPLVSLLCLPALAEGVQIYGAVNMGLVWLDNGSTQQIKVENLYALSRLGFKGEHDLGEGYRTFWKVETQVKPDDGNGAAFNPSGWGNREAWVGVSGQFGRLGLGRGYHPYQDMANLFDWHEGVALFGGFAINLHDRLLPARLDNGIRYDCPTASMWRCAIHLSLGENRGADVAASDAWSTYLQWQQGGWRSALALARLDNLRSPQGLPQAGRQSRAALVSLAYTRAPWEIGVQQQYGRTRGGGLMSQGRLTRQAYLLHRDGLHQWKASVMQGDDRRLDGLRQPDTGFVRYALGRKHAFSARTALILELGGEQAEGATADQRYLTAGLLHYF